MALCLPFVEGGWEGFKMTAFDKLSAMEKLWDDFCKDPDAVRSPEWHKDILETREGEIASGEARFHPLSETKKRIRNQIE